MIETRYMVEMIILVMSEKLYEWDGLLTWIQKGADFIDGASNGVKVAPMYHWDKLRRFY